MPLEVFEGADSLTNIVQLRMSAVFEMVISLHTLLFSDRHPAWTNEARAALPPDLLDEARAIYEPYKEGQVFYELALDYPDHGDVPGFIAHVRHMDPTTFLWYLLGRVVTLEQLDQINFDPEALTVALRTGPAGPYDEHFYETFLAQLPLTEMLADLSAIQNRLADVWDRYWDEFFSSQVEHLRPHWESALADKERFLARDGGEALFKHISEGKDLPPLLPADHPYTEVVCIPVYLLPRSRYMVYG